MRGAIPQIRRVLTQIQGWQDIVEKARQAPAGEERRLLGEFLSLLERFQPVDLESLFWVRQCEAPYTIVLSLLLRDCAVSLT